MGRGSVSYSQPSSPKGDFSLSPVSSLSTECNEDYDSESCASLNSVNSSMCDEYLLNTPILRASQSKEITIHENEENIINITPINTECEQINSIKLKLPTPKIKKKRKSKKHKTKKSIKHKARRNSKDCSDITLISRLTAKSIQLWSVSDVVQWIKWIEHGKFKEHAHKFRDKKIDGKKLNRMNRSMLQHIEIYHPLARKSILAHLQKLKKKIRSNNKKQINLYAKKHEYKEKKKKKAHRRYAST